MAQKRRFSHDRCGNRPECFKRDVGSIYECICVLSLSWQIISFSRKAQHTRLSVCFLSFCDAGGGTNLSFTGNTLDTCCFESSDVGSFYVCGQVRTHPILLNILAFVLSQSWQIKSPFLDHDWECTCLRRRAGRDGLLGRARGDCQEQYVHPHPQPRWHWSAGP